MIARIGLYAFAALLIAAHFLRQGNMTLTVLCALAPLLFAIRKRWVLLVLQAAAYIAASVWMGTAIAIVRERIALGRGYGTALLILALVTGVTLLAGLLLNSRAMSGQYPSATEGAGATTKN